MSILKTQFGSSLTSDFQENTWTFEMQNDFSITAGEFAIIPKEKFDKFLASVKEMVDCIGSNTYFQSDSEAVLAVEEILNLIV